MKINTLLKILIPLFSLIVGIHALNLYKILELPVEFLLVTRIIFHLFFFYYAFQKRSLTTWIFFSMLLGIEVGYDFPAFASGLKVVSKIFLRLIKSIIAPLLFATLSIGIAGHADFKQLGRMAWKSILYFEIITTIALFIGLTAINLSKAGEGIVLPPAEAEEIPIVPKQNWEDIILHIFPENIAKSVAEGQILQIVIFSLLFGTGLAMIKQKQRENMLSFLEALAETMFKFTNLIMYFAPFAVFAAIAYTVSHMGLQILENLFRLVATLYAALLALIFLVFVPVALIFRINIRKFIKAISEPFSVAFATTTSEAALPKAMEVLEKFGAPKRVIGFVLPMGYSFNLDGTTLYLSLATIFVAQAAGINLSIGQQLLMVFTLMLTSKGVAGVPRASLVILLGTAASFGLPVEPIFIIVGIDEIMDMARSGVNVVGNCLATMVIARWEGELDDEKMNNFELTDEI